MKFTLRLAAATGLATVAALLLAGPASASSGGASPHGSDHGGAVFVQTDAADNSIVAYDRNTDGTLTQVAVYPTGGRGGALGGAVVDKQASQGSLVYDREHRLLFALNSGSDSISVYGVRGTELNAKQTIGSGGSFPASIAIHDNIVFVMNSRGGGSIQGFVLTRQGLVSVPNWHRDLGLPAETPGSAQEFTHTPGQIGFTPDGSQLVLTTKAASQSVLVFGFGKWGQLSAAPVATVTGNVPFGFGFDRRGHLVLTEAAGNIATFDIDRSGALSLINRTAIGQSAPCWVAVSGKHAFVSNAGSATVSAFTLDHKGVPTSVGNFATKPGTIDAAASPDGRFLYVQTGAQGTVDQFRINGNGSLTAIGSVVVPGAVGR